MINETYCYWKKSKNDYCDINLIETFSKVIDELNNLLNKLEWITY